MIDAVLGVFETPHRIPGGPDVQCPVCGQHSPPAWNTLFFQAAGGTIASLLSGKAEDRYDHTSLDYMRCGNEACQQLIVRIHEQTARFVGTVPIQESKSWIARPRFGESQRPIDPLVPGRFKTDYAEAAAILDISHRMSAVLARRILGDLLKQYTGRNEKRLTAQIDAFTAESGHPSTLTENLHHFREVGDFCAHSQEAEEEGEPEPVVVDIDREEAEWTLDLVDRLFDYFIIQPQKDERIRRRVDEKGKRVGRKPLRKPPEDGDS